MQGLHIKHHTHTKHTHTLQGFEDPIAKLPEHPEPAPSLHLPGEEEDKLHPLELPSHFDRSATEAAAHAPLHPGDQGDSGKPSFAAVAAKLRGGDAHE